LIEIALTTLGSQTMKHAIGCGLTALMLAASIPAAEAAVCARGVYRAGALGRMVRSW